MVIYNPRRSTERLQELIVDLSTTSKKKTSETLDRGSKVYQQGQNAIKREFQGVQEAINTLQTNHQMVTKNRADIFHAHQKDNEYIQQLLDKNYKQEIKNIDARAQTELKNSESWRKIIGIGTGYALQQAQKEKDRLNTQSQGLAVDLDISTPKKFAGLDTYLTELTKNKNKDIDILDRAGWSPENIERVVKLTPRELVNLRKASAIYTGKSIVGSIEKQYRKPIHQLPEGGDPVSYYTLRTYVTSSKYRTVEGHDQAASILNNAHNTIVKNLREELKGNVSLKLFDEHIAPQLRTHWQKEIPGVLKPLLRNVEAQARERDFEANFPAQWDVISKLEGLNVPKTLGKMFEDWMLTKPDNISAEEWTMQYTDRIIGFGVRSGKVSRHQARMYSYHPIFDKTDQTTKPWRRKFKKAAIALDEIIRKGALQAQQISGAERGNKRAVEKELVNEFIENFKENMFLGNKDLSSFQDAQIMVGEMLKSGNYPPDIAAQIKQKTFLGPSSAPMVAGKEFMEDALNILNNPKRKLTFEWIMTNGRHVPPSIKDDVISLWRDNGGDGPGKSEAGYNEVQNKTKSIENILFGKRYGNATYLPNGEGKVDVTVADGLTYAQKKFNADLINAYKNNGGNWADAAATAYTAFQEDLKGTKENPSIYAIETTKKGRRFMPHFENRVSSVPEPEDHIGDYDELYQTLGNKASMSNKFEPIPDAKLETIINQFNNGEPMSWDPILDRLVTHTGLPEEQILTNLAVGYNLRNEDIIGRPPLEVKSNPRFTELMEAARGVKSAVTAPYSRECEGIVMGNVTLRKDWSVANCTALGQTDKLAPYLDLTGEGYNLEELQLLKQETDPWRLDRIREPGGMRT